MAVRGGCWKFGADTCAAAYRYLYSPLSQRFADNGLRLARVAVDKEPVTLPPLPPPKVAIVTPWRNSNSWVVRDQELHQLDSIGRHWLLFGDPAWTDYDFEVEAQAVAGGSEFHVAFRVTGPNHCTFAVVGGFGNNFHALLNKQQGQPIPVGTIGWLPGKTERGRWYRVRIEARGTRFKMLLDGKQIMALDDGMYPRGCVGLGTFNTSARFRNAKVTASHGKVLFAGWPDVKTQAPNLALPARTTKLLDELMLKYMTKIGCSAAALAVDQNSVSVHVRAYGWRNKERTLPATPETMFPIGIGTRPLLSAGVRQLAERGNLSLNDALLKRLKIARLGKVIDPRVWKITIEHLLESKTGWDNATVELVQKAIRARGFNGPIPVEVMLGGLATLPLKEAPGTKALGCSYHFDIMVHLVNKIAGRSPAVYFRHELLGHELPGIAASGSPEALPASVWNATSEPVCASAPALLEVMRHFGVNGRKGRFLGAWTWYNANFTCQLTWRGDGINAVVLFNGCRDGSTHAEIDTELRKLLDTLKAGAP